MSFGIIMPETTIEPSKSADQKSADVPSGDITETKFYDTNGEVYATITRPSGDLISRADALEAVKRTKPIVRSTERNWGKMIAEQHSKELVKALKALPSADVVSRDEYIKLLEESIWKSEHIGKMFEYIDDCVTEMCDRQKVNSAEWVAEKEREFEELHRPKGEWIDREDSTDMFFLYRYECSVCGGKNVFNSSYCPNCGAHMR